jgi:hypothetical protein
LLTFYDFPGEHHPPPVCAGSDQAMDFVLDDQEAMVQDGQSGQLTY